ncbi:IucA/IucC family protein [Gandjariella thermophila]|uniref:Siderophore biosynthesis protein IucA n=1 Tax=Gandjariella thermophila TaxID=1931992 RepID=A0A4D4IXB6_9PSEU|nr:IucA/IucC family protein [Gandjariella thermophila]GDY28841.1 siderophore biosynthesis protein IucA [Gandjariella thermophila]
MTTWTSCARALLAKAIGELCFEGLLRPEPTEHGYLLRLAGAAYTFTARRTAFGGWAVDPASVRRSTAGILGDDVTEPTHDVQQFLADACRTLDLDPATMANMLAEATATLAADVIMAESARPVAALANLGHAELEGHLTGHPWLVANKGRLGFSAADLAAYAPEARTPVRLPWLAVHRGLAEFRGTPELSERVVVTHELDAPTVAGFAEALRERGHAPDAYVWLPVHPWQLDHVVRTLWAPELATGRIVELGEAPDRYLPTQAIRTMSNVDHPERYQVKLPLRILNTSVYRGIPPHCTLAAPMTTQWLRGIWSADKRLAEWGTELLGEVASVTVRHPQLSRVDGVPYQWLETLGCIWREPLSLGAGERAWALAAVLHVDRDGRPLVSEYIRRAGGDAEAWLAALLRVLLRPLVHVLYTYGITVNPHGENVLIVTGADGLPARAVVKDLVDDVNVSVEPVPERGPEPDSHDRVLPRKPWHVLRQYLVDALLVGVFRPLADLLAEHHGIDREAFWGRVRGEIEAYRAHFPEVADRMTAGDLLGPTLGRYPLNSYRLLTGYGDLAQRPPVPGRGDLPNPLHDVAAVPPPDGW